MNGKELEIYRSNQGLILIRTESGGKIDLKYDVLPYRLALFTLLSLVILASFAIPIFRGKNR